MKGYCRLSNVNLVNLIEDKTDQRLKREVVFIMKQLKALAKRREIHTYSRLTKKILSTLIINNIKEASVDEELEITDGREALNDVFGTVKIGSKKKNDVNTFLKLFRSTIISKIQRALTKKKGLKVDLVFIVEMMKPSTTSPDELIKTEPFLDLCR